MTEKCDVCYDTGWYGDNCAGIIGNREVHPCDAKGCNADAYSYALQQIAALQRDTAKLKRENSDLLALTQLIAEHPEGYEGPCLCKMCMVNG